MSFLQKLQELGLWGQQPGQPQQQNPYGLNPQQMRQAAWQSVGNLGSQIMALSQQMTPAQRAAMMSRADFTGGFQQNLYNQAQMKLLQDKQRQAAEEDERSRAAKMWLAQKIGGMPDSTQKRNAMIYLQLGDVQKAAEVLTAGREAPEYQIVNGYRVERDNPNAPAIPIPGLPGKEEEGPNPSDVRAAAKDYYTSPEYTTFTNLTTSLGSLRESIDRPDKVADLDFVYAAANALDPGSVVREGDYLQIVRTQGLSGELIATINQVAGGQGLTRETREKLYRLIQGRANEWGKATTRRRDAVLRYSNGILTPEMLDLPGTIPGLPPPIVRPQSSAPGRTDRIDALPEPELVGVE